MWCCYSHFLRRKRAGSFSSTGNWDKEENGFGVRRRKATALWTVRSLLTRLSQQNSAVPYTDRGDDKVMEDFMKNKMDFKNS